MKGRTRETIFPWTQTTLPVVDLAICDASYPYPLHERLRSRSAVVSSTDSFSPEQLARAGVPNSIKTSMLNGECGPTISPQ